MKKIKQITLLAILFISGSTLFAQPESNQQKAVQPAWASDKGFWVIETNVKTPRRSTVHFYTNEQQLVYSELVEGKRLNVKRKKTLVRLKSTLENVMYAWEKTGEVNAQSLLAAKK